MANALAWVRARLEGFAVSLWTLEYRVTEWRMRREAK